MLKKVVVDYSDFVKALKIAYDYTSTIHFKPDNNTLYSSFKDASNSNLIRLRVIFEGDPIELLFDLENIRPVTKMKFNGKLVLEIDEPKVTFVADKTKFTVLMVAKEYSNFFEKDLSSKITFDYEFYVNKKDIASVMSSFKNDYYVFEYDGNAFKIGYREKTKAVERVLLDDAVVDSKEPFKVAISHGNLERVVKHLGIDGIIQCNFVGSDSLMKFSDDIAEIIVAPYIVEVGD